MRQRRLAAAPSRTKHSQRLSLVQRPLLAVAINHNAHIIICCPVSARVGCSAWIYKLTRCLLSLLSAHHRLGIPGPACAHPSSYPVTRALSVINPLVLLSSFISCHQFSCYNALAVHNGSLQVQGRAPLRYVCCRCSSRLRYDVFADTCDLFDDHRCLMSISQQCQHSAAQCCARHTPMHPLNTPPARLSSPSPTRRVSLRPSMPTPPYLLDDDYNTPQTSARPRLSVSARSMPTGSQCVSCDWHR